MRSKLRLLVAALCAAAIPAGLIGTTSPARASAQCPWMDTSKSADQRAQLLLSAMSLDDKITMVTAMGTSSSTTGWPDTSRRTLLSASPT
jgi:beta-glucosidase